MEESRPRVRPVGMFYSPSSQLALARARNEDLVREADRARLARSLKDDRLGALSRIRAHLARKRHPNRHPVTA